MNDKIILEIIGYIGSAFVLISFLMANVTKLRIMNAVGSLISVIYGFLITAYPTVVMNLALLIINCIYIYRHFYHKENFSFIDSSINDSSFKFFINRNLEDIKLFFPDFEKSLKNIDYLKLIFCKNEIVGFFAAVLNQTELDIIADYIVEEHRDYSAGFYLYKELEQEGFKKLQFIQKSQNHKNYLKLMGFEKKDNKYIKNL